MSKSWIAHYTAIFMHTHTHINVLGDILNLAVIYGNFSFGLATLNNGVKRDRDQMKGIKLLEFLNDYSNVSQRTADVCKV